MTHPLQDSFNQLVSLQEQAEEQQLELFRSTATAILLREGGCLSSIEMYGYGKSFMLDWADWPGETYHFDLYEALQVIAVPDGLDLMVEPCTVSYEELK